MKQRLNIRVSKRPQSADAVSCKTICMREYLMRLLLGKKQKMTILIPGDLVTEVAISESMKGVLENEKR